MHHICILSFDITLVWLIGVLVSHILFTRLRLLSTKAAIQHDTFHSCMPYPSHCIHTHSFTFWLLVMKFHVESGSIMVHAINRPRKEVCHSTGRLTNLVFSQSRLFCLPLILWVLRVQQVTLVSEVSDCQ